MHRQVRGRGSLMYGKPAKLAKQIQSPATLVGADRWRKRLRWVASALNVADLLGLWPLWYGCFGMRRPEKQAKLSELFGFASPCERVLLAIGCIAHALVGASFPFMFFFMGAIYDSGVKPTLSQMQWVVIGMSCLGLGILLLNWVAGYCIDASKERMLARYKAEYLKAIVRQDIAWFDTSDPQKLSTFAGETMNAISEGLANKTWIMIQYRTRFVGSIVMGLSISWRVACMVIITSPSFLLAFRNVVDQV